MKEHSKAQLSTIESIKIKNYRALKDFELAKVTTFAALLGPNGSGKSTLFDVFAFLAECFKAGLRKAWDKRGRFKEMRSRDAAGPIVFEIRYTDNIGEPIVYHLEIEEDDRGPFVQSEKLSWRRKGPKGGRPFDFLNYRSGKGWAIAGENPKEGEERESEALSSRELLAINTLGQFDKHPRVRVLRNFIEGWYLSYLTADSTRNSAHGLPEAGPQEHLYQSGDNLPNVIQYLQESHPEVFQKIIGELRGRIPRLEKVESKVLLDNRLMLRFKDAPFSKPILAKYASDGTLKMLAYLIVLNDPQPAPLIGIEEPENHLHPKLLPELAEECRASAVHSQVLVSTHSPFFLNGMKPSEVWILNRDFSGYTKASRASDIPIVEKMMGNGALLGDLWMEGYFNPAAHKVARRR
jgi:predicted ATPase